MVWPSPVVLSYGSATPPATVPLLPEEVVHLTVGLFLSVPLVLHLLETPFLAPHPVVRLSNSHSQRLGSEGQWQTFLSLGFHRGRRAPVVSHILLPSPASQSAGLAGTPSCRRAGPVRPWPAGTQS